MDVIEVRKKKATFETVAMSKVHPKPQVLKDKSKWCEQLPNGEWLCSVKFTVIGYDDKPIIKSFMFSAPDTIKDENELRGYVDKYMKDWEIQLQDEEIERIKNETIIKVYEYEVG